MWLNLQNGTSIADGDIITFGNRVKSSSYSRTSPDMLFYNEKQKFVIAGDVLFVRQNRSSIWKLRAID